MNGAVGVLGIGVILVIIAALALAALAPLTAAGIAAAIDGLSLDMAADKPADEVLALEANEFSLDESVTDAELADALANAVVIDPDYSHAAEEHPDTYQSVRDCFDTKGQYVAFQVTPKKRWLRVCLVDATTVGFQIVDAVGRELKERTAYIKDGIKSLKELFEYAKRMGYPRFTGPF